MEVKTPEPWHPDTEKDSGAYLATLIEKNKWRIVSIRRRIRDECKGKR